MQQGSNSRGMPRVQGLVQKSLRGQQPLRGFSMIEVLVTMAVMSIGLLGVAGMQAKSLQFSFASYQRSVAVVQANDLAERLWAGACVLGDNARRTQIFDDWQADWSNDGRLPDWNPALAYNAGTLTIDIRWMDERVGQHGSGEGQQQTALAEQFVYELVVPRPAECPAGAGGVA